MIKNFCKKTIFQHQNIFQKQIFNFSKEIKTNPSSQLKKKFKSLQKYNIYDAIKFTKCHANSRFDESIDICFG